MACGVLQFSLQLEGAGIELVILALLGDELFVAAALYYAALLQDHYGLGVADGGETVGYHTKTVRPDIRASIPSWTIASVRVSMDEVASSIIMTGGSATAARAMEMS